MTQHVTIPTAFASVADTSENDGRFALQAVRAIPTTAGRAIIEATDARIIAIREVSAQITESCLVPAKVLRDEDGKKTTLQSVEISGAKCSSGNTELPLLKDARFPKSHEVVPFADGRRRRVLIDVALLVRLAKAISDENPRVMLMVGDHDEAVCVCGDNGIGAIMPLDAGAANFDSDRLSFNRLRKLHADAAKSLTPKPPKKSRRRKAVGP